VENARKYGIGNLISIDLHTCCKSWRISNFYDQLFNHYSKY